MNFDFIKIIYMIGSFLMGGIPFGLVITKIIKKVDIRNYGSGNIGATNVFRVLGIKYTALTFLLDGLKSYLPILLAKNIYGYNFAISTMFFTVTGHIFSPWLGFRGGKGVASFMLGLLAIDIKLFLLMAITWLIVFFTSHISAVAALTSLLIVLLTSCFLLKDLQFYTILLLSIIIFWAHRKNISEILDKLNFK